MSILLAFGLFMIFLGSFGFILGSVTNILPEGAIPIVGIIGLIAAILILITGLM